MEESEGGKDEKKGEREDLRQVTEGRGAPRGREEKERQRRNKEPSGPE